MAGGFLVAVGAMGGTAVGLSQGAAVPGFLAGLGAGVVMAIIIWLIDRRR